VAVDAGRYDYGVPDLRAQAHAAGTQAVLMKPPAAAETIRGLLSSLK